MLRAGAAAETVTVALDFLVVSAALVAVTVTPVLDETVGAVNMPPLEIAPELVDQVTPVLLVPWTVALNCWLPPDETVVLDGETATVMVVVGALIATEALAFLVLSATLVAVTVTLLLLVTLGAVKKPPVEIVPPVDDQVTAVFVVPETLALNCLV